MIEKNNFKNKISQQPILYLEDLSKIAIFLSINSFTKIESSHANRLVLLGLSLSMYRLPILIFYVLGDILLNNRNSNYFLKCFQCI